VNRRRVFSGTDKGVMFEKVFRLARPKFLLYSPIAFTTGCSFAYAICGGPNVSLSAARIISGLLITYASHIMTHFFNEFHDLEPDRANKNPSPWTGGSRVLVKEELSPSVSLRLGQLFASCIILSGFFMPSPHSKYCIFAIVFFAWQYSAPPLCLQKRGLGEATVALVLNVLTPMFGFFIVQLRPCLPNHHFWSTTAFLCLIEHSRMMVMNMADYPSDLMSGKTTLVVRLGIARTKIVYKLELQAAYLLLVVMMFCGYLPSVTALLLILTLPLAVLQARSVLCCDFDAPFWASQFNATCMGFAYLGTFFMDANSGRSVLESNFLILYPTLPIIIFQRLHIRDALSLRTMRTPRENSEE
jgi:1,4-dihydroxy-2-naphthoate octaprenyltransferase